MQKGLRFQFAVLSNILFLAYYLLLFVSRHFFFLLQQSGVMKLWVATQQWVPVTFRIGHRHSV